jgi:hypothetical protein
MSMQKRNRDPGEAIKRQLRDEVNFGCPVQECGSPILTYHHFDPPWADNFEHNVPGMVALCKPHHDRADGGLWTKEQLREMKRNPYVNNAIRVQWPYSPECLVLKVGPCLVVGSGSALRLNGRHVMHFRPEAIERLGMNTVTFDSEINDANGRVWLRITDNWFDLETSDTSDVEFPPHAKRFVAKHDDQTKIRLQFRTYKIPALEIWLRSIVSPNQRARDEGKFKPQLAEDFVKAIVDARAVDSDENVRIMEISGQFRTPEVKVVIRRDKLTADFDASILGRPERLDFHSHLVDEAHRISLKFDSSRHVEREFFGIG